MINQPDTVKGICAREHPPSVPIPESGSPEVQELLLRSSARLDSPGASSATRPMQEEATTREDTYILSYQPWPYSLLGSALGSISLYTLHFGKKGFPFCTSWAATKSLGLGIPTASSACDAYSRVAEWKVR